MGYLAGNYTRTGMVSRAAKVPSSSRIAPALNLKSSTCNGRFDKNQSRHPQSPFTFIRAHFPFLLVVARTIRSAVAVKAEKKEMMMWEALREGLDEEMERDPTVCLMGTLISAVAIVTVALSSTPAGAPCIFLSLWKID